MFATKSVKGLLALSSTTEAFQEQFSFSSDLVPKLCTCGPYFSTSHTATVFKKLTPLLYSTLLVDTEALKINPVHK